MYSGMGVFVVGEGWSFRVMILYGFLLWMLRFFSVIVGEEVEK